MDVVNPQRCVMCHGSIPGVAYRCQKCRQISADVNVEQLGGNLMDATSKCCEADVDMLSKITCSEACHELFIDKTVREVGEYKRVVDIKNGQTHLVPTRHIIEYGLRWEELGKFPVEQ